MNRESTGFQKNFLWGSAIGVEHLEGAHDIEGKGSGKRYLEDSYSWMKKVIESNGEDL